MNSTSMATPSPPDLFENPAAWGGALPANQPEMVYMLLDGAKDMHIAAGNAGGSFFVENLRSELHPIRSTLEHYAATAVIEGADAGGACGVVFHPQAKAVRLRVTATTTRTTYDIDRWD